MSILARLRAPNHLLLSLVPLILLVGFESAAQAAALSGAQQSLIKLMNSNPVSVDLRCVGDVIIQLRRKVTDNPHDGNLRLRLGVYLFQTGDLEGAATEMKRAAAAAPTDYLIHTLLARVLDSSMDEASAEIEFRRAIELKPDIAEAHLYYGDSLFRRGEVSQAVSEYREAARLRPSDLAFSGLSQALLATRDVTGAIKAARQAVSVDPSSSCAHATLTRALLVAGEYHCALRTARQATLLDPTSVDGH